MRIHWMLSLALAGAVAPGAARADACADTEESLRAELALRFSGPDDPGTLARRKRLETLFIVATPACAKALYEQLGEEPTGDELSEQFHYALATPTRAALRKTLHDVFAPYDKLDAEIEATVNGAAERDHLRCWVEKLRQGKATDDRVLVWSNVCPLDEQSCPNREHPTDAEIAAIASKADVESATPEALPIFHFLSTRADLALIGDIEEALAALREDRRESAEAARRLSGDDLPPHYAAMAEWIAEKEDDPSSVLYCPRPAP